MASMRATRELPAGAVFPGHGDPFTGHAALIDERFEMHERRAAKFAALIADRPTHGARDRARDPGSDRASPRRC